MFQEVIEKAVASLIHENRSLEGNLKVGPPDYEAGVPSIPPRCLLFDSCTSWKRQLHTFCEAYTFQILNLIFFFNLFGLEIVRSYFIEPCLKHFSNFHGNERWSVSAASLCFSPSSSRCVCTRRYKRATQGTLFMRYSFRICKKK
jgi:hypothetical protein